MTDAKPETVCCLLCHGIIIFKEDDKTRFNNHMINEHGAFFSLDFLLASSMMDEDQKAARVNKEISKSEMRMNSAVRCLLCDGVVLFNGEDKTRFKEHMKNQHGVFFDVD